MTAAVKRIIVAIDASPASAAACAAAAEIAASAGAELIGLFIEDPNLWRSAELPMTQLVGAQSAEILPFSRELLENQLRVQARQARRELEAVATSVEVRWSFRIARGPMWAELAAAAADADLVSMGSIGRSAAGQRSVGQTLVQLLGSPPGRVLVARRSDGISRKVGILIDPSSPIDGLLDAASAVLRGAGSTLQLLIVAPVEATAHALERAACERLEARGHRAEARWLGPLSGRIIGEACTGLGLVVIAAGSDLVADESELTDMLSQTASPILFVR